MSSRPVGLILDTSHDDLGNRAIRQVMEEFAAREGIEAEVLDARRIEAFPDRTLVIGGGDLLGPRGSAFYDAFRVPGPHVLNSVAVSDGADVAYLADYAYVSVRSSADRARIASARPDAAVVPCVSSRLVDSRPEGAPESQIGIQLSPQAFSRATDWHEHLREIRGLTKVYLPLGAGDRGALARLMHAVGEGRSIGVRSPRELIAIIGRLRLLICSSLQAAIFAYLQNVPFLVFEDSPRTSDYWRDRGLGENLFRSGSEMLRRARVLLDVSVDHREAVERDRQRLEEHFSLLKKAIGGGGRVSVPASLQRLIAFEPPLRFAAEANASASPNPAPSVSDENLHALVSPLDALLGRLHREIASQCERIAELAREVDRFRTEREQRDALLADIYSSRAWQLAEWMRRAWSRLRRLLGAPQP